MTYIKAMAEKVELSNEDVITASGDPAVEEDTRPNPCTLRGGRDCTGSIHTSTTGKCYVTNGTLSLHDSF